MSIATERLCRLRVRLSLEETVTIPVIARLQTATDRRIQQVLPRMYNASEQRPRYLTALSIGNFTVVTRWRAGESRPMEFSRRR